jgi:hypothetical protein
MRIYSKTGIFNSGTTYYFHCEYCGREHSVNTTLEREIKVEKLNEPPTIQELLAEAQRVFKQNQGVVLSLAEKWEFAVNRKSAKCPNCGFYPTYTVKRKKTVYQTILMLIIGAGMAIPFFVPGTMPDTAMVITFSLLCFVPYLIYMGFLFHQLSPNRKLMRALSDEGRSLAPPEKPRIVFGPVLSKSEKLT